MLFDSLKFMNSTFVNLLLLGLVMLTGLRCGKVEEPQFRRLENFGVRKLDLQQAQIGFDATFFNPNRFGVAVKEAVFDIYVDSTYFGKFTQPAEIAVNPEAFFSVPMEGSVSWQQALRSEWKNRIGKEVLLKANGVVKVGKAGVFITRNLNYQGKHKLDMDLLKNPAGAGLFNR